MMRMKMKKKITEMSPVNGLSDDGVGGSEKVEWEVRPGGMLVQKRNPHTDRSSVLAPTIKIRVTYGSIHHEIHISSEATFGELKKLLASPTGLHPEDQKLIYKNKERDSKSYLDMAGVKDRSKIVLVEDPTRQERRYLEMRKNAKMEKASKSISEISLEVDKLGIKVSALEGVISKDEKVAERDLLNLIELLMNQLIKLDGIIVDGDFQLQRRVQIRRVQKYVETLDLLKIRNAMPKSYAGQIPRRQPQGHQEKVLPWQAAMQMATLQQRPSASAIVVTTKWETFDSIPASSTSTTITAPSKMGWELF